MFVAPPLIAVIGPVNPALLSAWAAHYRALGVERFMIAVHLPLHTDRDRRDRLQDAFRTLGIVPEIVKAGPWHEDTNTHLRDALRAHAGAGWHMLADSDELHTYPAPLADVLAAAEDSGTGTVGGLLLDRVTSDGALHGFDPATGLDAGYPLGGFVTHHLLRGDPRKVVLAHSTVDVASGQHRAPGRRPVNRPPVVVHHFKWREDLPQIIERRAAHWANGTWQTRSPALLSEARRLTDHLKRHGGRLTPTPAMPLRPVTLTEAPTWWAEEATRLVATWKPPARQPVASTRPE